MNKKLITLAVAAAMAAPAIASAEAVMYGKLNMSVDYYDIKQNMVGGTVGDSYEYTEQGFKGWSLNRGVDGAGAPRSNRLGVKGSEDLGNGLKAIYQIEFGISMANENDTDINNGDKGTVVMRNTFVGLAGNWGTFLVGRHDTPLKISTGKLDLFSDTIGDYNGTVGFVDTRADNAIAYISPSFSGFQLAGAIVPGSGSTIGGSNNIDSDSISEAWSLAAIYKNGPFYASAAYESYGSDLGASSVTTGTDGDLFANSNMGVDGYYPVYGYVPVYDEAGEEILGYDRADGTSSTLVTPGQDWNFWRLGLGLLDWNGFTLTAIYEQHSNYGFVNDADPQLWQIQAGYAFGNNMVKAMYGQYDTNNKQQFIDTSLRDIKDYFNDADKSTWALGYDYNFSKRTTAYAVYTDVDDDRPGFEKWNAFSVGMIHSF